MSLRINKSNHLKARRLRSEFGLSALSIGRKLGVSKGTVHNWIKDIELTKSQKLVLKANSAKLLIERSKSLAKPIIQVDCANCGKHTFNPKFCSLKCSAVFNNKHHPKRHVDPARYVCMCGGKKNHKADRCHDCKIKFSLQVQLRRTLKDATGRGNARVKWSHVRGIAKRVLEDAGVDKECKVCGFDVLVDTCHIKPISEFSEDSLLSEINSKKNLVYLCPNHHKMLDRGLLSEDEIKIIT